MHSIDIEQEILALDEKVRKNVVNTIRRFQKYGLPANINDTLSIEATSDGGMRIGISEKGFLTLLENFMVSEKNLSFRHEIVCKIYNDLDYAFPIDFSAYKKLFNLVERKPRKEDFTTVQLNLPEHNAPVYISYPKNQKLILTFEENNEK